MKEFDFDKVGKKMPYTTPEGFFDKFKEDTIQRIEKRDRSLIRSLWIGTSVAASLLCILSLSQLDIFDFQNSPISVDDYIEALSYDELSQLVEEVDVEAEFYANL